MIFKPEVKEEGLSHQMWFALGACAAVFKEYGYEFVVTALLDGDHSTGIHARGQAADIRVRHVPKDRLPDIVVHIVALLNPMGFDVVYEKAGDTPKTTGPHLHIEYDPKYQEQFFYRREA